MKLFESTTIRGLTVKNRIAKSAMIEGLCDAEGRITPALVRLYGRWARGGASLLVMGDARITHGAGVTGTELGLGDDGCLEGLSQVARVVHEQGAALFAQIGHPGPQIAQKTANHLGPVAPSSRFSLASLEYQRQLNDVEIRRIVDAFGTAAGRVRRAGLDGVQLHGAHGYLISRFISSRFNRRQDRWGGDFMSRLRFLREIVEAVRRQVGDDFPLTIKLNAHDGQPGGLQLAESIRLGQMLQTLGVDAIEVSAGTVESGRGYYPSRGGAPVDLSLRMIEERIPIPRRLSKLVSPLIRRVGRQVALQGEAYFLHEAARFAAELDLPIWCVGGIRTLARAEEILQTTRIAMVSLARPLIRQPQLPKLWQQGDSPTARCTSCNRCLLHVGLGDPLRCYIAEAS